MAVAFVANVTAWGNGAAGPQSSGSFTPTAGNTIVVANVDGSGSGKTLVYSGSVNTPTSRTTFNDATDGNTLGLADVLSAVGGSQTLTVNSSPGGDNEAGFAIRYSGVGAATYGSKQTLGTTTPTGNAVTVGVGSVLLAFCFNVGVGPDQPVGQANGGVTPTDRDTGSNAIFYTVTEYVGTGGSITPSWTSASSSNWVVVWVLLDPPASGGSKRRPQTPNKGNRPQNYGARTIGFKQGISTAAANINIASAGTIVIVGSASLTATGGIAAAGTVFITASSALTGLGTVAAGGTLFITGASALTATGTLAAAGSLVIVGAASLTSVGTLAAAGTLVINGSATMPGANDVASAGNLVIVGAAAPTAVGSLAANGTLVITGATALTAIGTVASAGALTITGAAALTGLGSLAAAGTAVIIGAADLTAPSANDTSAAGALVITGSATLSAVGLVAADGAIVIVGAATLGDGVIVSAPSVAAGSVPGFVAGSKSNRKRRKDVGPVMREGQVFGEEYPVSPHATTLKAAVEREQARKSKDRRAAIEALMRELL